MGIAKKNWIKPEMTILTRNNPEEAVLTACKGTGLDGPDEGTGSNGAWYGYAGNCFMQMGGEGFGNIWPCSSPCTT